MSYIHILFFYHSYLLILSLFIGLSGMEDSHVIQPTYCFDLTVIFHGLRVPQQSIPLGSVSL